MCRQMIISSVAHYLVHSSRQHQFCRSAMPARLHTHLIHQHSTHLHQAGLPASLWCDRHAWCWSARRVHCCRWLHVGPVSAAVTAVAPSAAMKRCSCWSNQGVCARRGTECSCSRPELLQVHAAKCVQLHSCTAVERCTAAFRAAWLLCAPAVLSMSMQSPCWCCLPWAAEELRTAVGSSPHSCFCCDRHLHCIALHVVRQGCRCWSCLDLCLHCR